MRRASARRSSDARRLLTTLSAKSISRAAADRLPAPTILTNVRSSGMSLSMWASPYFPFGEYFLHPNAGRFPSQEELKCIQADRATSGRPSHFRQTEPLRIDAANSPWQEHRSL